MSTTRLQCLHWSLVTRAHVPRQVGCPAGTFGAACELTTEQCFTEALEVADVNSPVFNTSTNCTSAGFTCVQRGGKESLRFCSGPNVDCPADDLCCQLLLRIWGLESVTVDSVAALESVETPCSAATNAAQREGTGLTQPAASTTCDFRLTTTAVKTEWPGYCDAWNGSISITDRVKQMVHGQEIPVDVVHAVATGATACGTSTISLNAGIHGTVEYSYGIADTATSFTLRQPNGKEVFAGDTGLMELLNDTQACTGDLITEIADSADVKSCREACVQDVECMFTTFYVPAPPSTATKRCSLFRTCTLGDHADQPATYQKINAAGSGSFFVTRDCNTVTVAQGVNCTGRTSPDACGLGPDCSWVCQDDMACSPTCVFELDTFRDYCDEPVRGAQVTAYQHAIFGQGFSFLDQMTNMCDEVCTCQPNAVAPPAEMCEDNAGESPCTAADGCKWECPRPALACKNKDDPTCPGNTNQTETGCLLAGTGSPCGSESCLYENMTADQGAACCGLAKSYCAATSDPLCLTETHYAIFGAMCTPSGMGDGVCGCKAADWCAGETTEDSCEARTDYIKRPAFCAVQHTCDMSCAWTDEGTCAMWEVSLLSSCCPFSGALLRRC